MTSVSFTRLFRLRLTYLGCLLQLANDPSTKGKYADFKCAGLGAMVKGGWPEPVVRRVFEQAGKPEIVCHPPRPAGPWAGKYPIYRRLIRPRPTH